VLALVSDIATKDGRASVHCLVVVDRKDFSTVGGHLMGECMAHFEVLIQESPSNLEKTIRKPA
jgi:predicted DNA-binding protein with PD1-like motif